MSEINNIFDIDELCLRTLVPRSILITIIEYGIIEPLAEFSDWYFTSDAILIVQKAVRLQRELELDWQGAALTMQLLEQIEQLSIENQRLQRRLARFL